VPTLEDVLAIYCRYPTEDEPIEVVKAFVAGLRTMRPDEVGPVQLGAVGVGPTGICWAVIAQEPNLIEGEGTIETWVGFQIPWALVRHTSHQDGVFQCAYRALDVTDPKIPWERPRSPRPLRGQPRRCANLGSPSCSAT
jgi:hypothetical protein